MHERRRILLLTLIMLAVAVGVAAIALSTLYEAAFEQQRARLVETVQSHARLMEAVARFDAKYSTKAVPGGAFAATLGQIRDAHARFKGFGETGEFLLAKREGDWIVFLLSHRHLDLDNLKPVPFSSDSSEFAEPMRRALTGESGSMVGLDYRGETVLAAYEPLAELDLGIVAKIDLVEVRAPFIQAGALAGGGALMLIFVGTVLFWRVSNPFIRALRESEERHRELFELSPIGVWEEDYSAVKPMIDRLRRKGVRDFRRYFREHPRVLRQMAGAIKVIDVNPALIDIYRASNKEAYLRAVTDSSRIEQWCRFYEEELAALAVGESRVVVEHPDKAYDGSDIVTRTITQIGEAYKDSWARVISTAEDVTEQKRIQAQLIQASKLSTLGEMATGIAHELNQPLSVIGMAAERAMDKFEGGDVDLEFISERLKQVIAQTERAAAIIDHMRMFGRQEGAEAPSEIDPRPAIEGALDTIGEQLRVLNIEVTTDIPRTCPPVLGHEVQLEQVVLNLLSNARDAIEANAARRGREGEPLGTIRLKVEVSESGKEIKMVVRDTGDGIPEAVMDRVFDPFFTTKERGGGTGLGLSISYGIITEMGGRIEVANVESGAEFTITLPVAEAG